MLLRYVNVVVRMKHLGLCLEDVNDSLYGPVGSNYVISNLVPRISLLLSLQGGRKNTGLGTRLDYFVLRHS